MAPTVPTASSLIPTDDKGPVHTSKPEFSLYSILDRAGDNSKEMIAVQKTGIKQDN